MRELKREFPGWHIYHLGDKWGARPAPEISGCASAEDLAAAIRAAHHIIAPESVALASLRSYAARTRRLRQQEQAAGEAWQRMRDEADRWRRFPRRYRAGTEPAQETAAAAADGAVSAPPDVIA
jgi:hypothetical protein